MKQLYSRLPLLGMAALLTLGSTAGYAQMNPRTYVYQNGVPVRAAHEIIVRFAPAALDAAMINNTSIQKGYLSNFLTPSALAAVSAAAGFNMGTVGVGKIFPDLTIADSTQFNRMGEPMPDDKMWAVLLLQLPVGVDEDAISTLLPRSGVPVVYAHLNPVMLPHGVPNDPRYTPEQKSLHYTAATPNSHINVEGAWDMATGRSSIKVGVLDTGVKALHPELGGVLVGGQDGFLLPPSLPYNDDADGHGTAVAGIIAAPRNDGRGIAGIAGGDDAAGIPGVRLYSYKTQPDPGQPAASLDECVAAMSAAVRQGMHIMNCSWGGPSLNTSLREMSALQEVLRRANEAKITVVASSGNEQSQNTILPAHVRDEWTLTVAATGLNGEWRQEPAIGGTQNGYSTPNPLVDVAAPGTASLVTTTLNTGGYGGFSGTSAAAPHVSGLAALLMSYWNVPGSPQDDLSPEDVERIIEFSATDKTAPPYGGSVQLTGHDDYTGWGLINATKALRSIDKSYNAVVHHRITTTPADVAYLRTESMVNISTGFRALVQPALYDVEVYEITAYGPSDYGSAVTTKGRWLRPSSTTLRGPIYAYNGNGATKALDDFNGAVLVGTAGKATLQFKAYAYHLIAKKSYNSSVVEPFDKWLPFNPTVAGQTGQIDYTNLLQFPQVCTNCLRTSGTGQLSAYPNPAREELTLQLPSAEEQAATVEVRTLAGQLVRTQSTAMKGRQNIHVSLQGLKTGMYLYRVQTSTGVYQGKFAKAD